MSASGAPLYPGRSLPCDFNSVELHAHRKNCAFLAVLHLGARAEHCAEVVVLHLLLVLADELAPPLLALLALHLALVQCGRCVKVGEFLLEVLIDFVIDLGESQFRAGDFFEDLPVRLHVLYGCAVVLDGSRSKARQFPYL